MIRVGIIGLSGIGFHAHLPAYEQLSETVKIEAVCDIDSVHLEKAASRYGITKLFTDYREMLELPEIDAVSICTPNYLHAPMTIDALNAGKHVLCEKPMAMNTQDARRMVDTARSRDRILMIALNNRFVDESVQLKTLIEAGRLGEIYAASTGWVRRRGVPGGWFRKKSSSGGGPLIDLGVHMLDLTWWLMGSPKCTTVSASTFGKIVCEAGDMGVELPDCDVEDSAFAFLRFANGSCLTLSVSWALNTDAETRYCRLFGTAAGANWSPLTLYTEENGRLVDTTFYTGNSAGHYGLIRHFTECIREGKKPISSGEEHFAVMEMLESIYISAQSGREISLASR